MRRRAILVWPLRTFVLLALISGHPASGQEPLTTRIALSCAARYASIYEVQFELVEAVIHAESNWDPNAVSRKGAAGLMQLMPDTARRFGVRNRFDIEQNIRGGVAYLAWLLQLFHGDFRLAIAAYLVGEGPILARRLSYSSSEVFQYVSRVAQLFRAYRGRSLSDRTRLLAHANLRGQR